MLTLAVYRVRPWLGFLLGLVQGFVFFGVLVRWLSVVGTDAWVYLTLYCAFWIGVVGAITAVVTRLRAWPVWAALAWVLQEAVRDRFPFGGFPWGRLAFAETDGPLASYAALAGAPLVTLATALLGTGLAFLVLRVRDGRRGAVVVVATALAVLALAGLLVPRPTAGESDGGPATAVVAVVQGGVPDIGLGAFDQRRAVLDNHVAQTRLLAARVRAGEVPAPELVVWPENSSDLDPYADPSVAAEISRAVDEIGVPVLVGAVITDPADPAYVLNVGIVWEPGTGPGERYAKTHPVPFGEYVPFRPLLSRLIDRFDRVPRDFAAGDRPGVLQLGPARIGDVICFEIAYDEVVRDVVTAGGRVITVQTNNATYATLGQADQQFAMSRLRAIEHGRAVLVAATSGISGVIAPDGSVVARLPELAAGSLVETVPLRDTLTVADRLGPWPEWLLVALAVAGVVLGARSGRGGRRTLESDGEPASVSGTQPAGGEDVDG